MGITIDRPSERSETVLRSGGVTITRLGSSEGERSMHKLAARTYVNADSTKIVEEGHPDAAFLLGNEDDEISVETAARLGLVGSESTSYSSMKKADLQAAAAERGLDTTGTVAELILRLEAADAGGTADQGAPEATASVGSPEA